MSVDMLPSTLNLARFQFAFTIVWHFLFPALTLGLASYLAVLEGLWLRTGEARYLDTFRNWLRIFAIAFAMGVVSGRSACSRTAWRRASATSCLIAQFPA